MPRPKGSKNKVKAATPSLDLTVLVEKIAAAEAEIDELDAALKAKKAELKELTKQKIAAEAAAAEKKAEETKAAIMAAIDASGKSLDEILEMLR